MSNRVATAVITGGSSGIGLKFAETLAERGYNLVLIAREENKLNQVCHDLAGRYDIEVQPVVADLADRDSVERLAKLIGQTKNLAYMINNAGFAIHVDADDNSRTAHDLQRDAVDVMALNVLLFSSAAASVMKKQKYGRIINIASTAAWTFQGNYSAIKRYVLTYTQGLALSLEGAGVTATAICPAWMHTNFHRAAGLDEPAIPEWLYVRPDQVVQQGLTGADKGRRVVVPTVRWKMIIWILAHGPVALRRQWTRVYLGSGNYKRRKSRRKRSKK